MGNFKRVWEQLPKKERILMVLITTFSFAVIALAMIHLLGVWNEAIYMYEPLMGVVMVLQAIQNWKRNKVVSILSLCAAMFVFAVAFVVVFLR